MKNPAIPNIPALVRAAVEPAFEVILFGSRARGDYRAESDWDFLILTPGEVPKGLEERLIKTIFEIELATGVAISFVLKSRQEWQRLRQGLFYQNVKKDGIAINA